MQVLFLCSFLLVSLSVLATDRPVAEWVIRQGGRVMAGGEPIAELRNLPAAEPLNLTGVDLYGTIIEPKDLERLSGLKHLKELYLPGPSWNPGAGSRLDANEELKFLSPLQTLEKLHFSLHFLTNVNVQDKGLKHLEPLTKLKELRLAQGRIKDFSLAGFSELEGLDLSYATATDEVLKSLSGLKKLKWIQLRDTLVTDAGLAHLSGVKTLEELDLYGLKISDRGLEHLRGLTELRKLNLLGGPISDEGAAILAGLPKLRELNLYRAEITNAGVAKLENLRKLEWLDLRYTRATTAGIERLRAALPACRVDFSAGAELSRSTVEPPGANAGAAEIVGWVEKGLQGKVGNGGKTISLVRTGVTDAQLAIVARLRELEELDLETTEIGDLGLEALSRLKSLRRLNLSSTTVSDRGLRHLSELPLESLNLSGTLIQVPMGLPPGLVQLDLSSTSVSELDGVRKLPALRSLNLAYSDLKEANLTGLPPLEKLDLTGTDIGDAGLGLLASQGTLQDLRLNHGRFTEKGFAALEPLVNLRRLEAVRTRLSGGVGPTLAKFSQLEFLNLDYTTINDEVVQAIAGLQLVELRLDSVNISDAAVDALAGMRSLRLLNLYHTVVSEAAHARLLKALPQTKIVWDRDSKLPNRRGS